MNLYIYVYKIDLYFKWKYLYFLNWSGILNVIQTNVSTSINAGQYKSALIY